MNDHINLYISERRAFEAAQREAARMQRQTGKAWTLRVLSAVKRCADGSLDRGFKAMMVPPRGMGTPYYL